MTFVTCNVKEQTDVKGWFNTAKTNNRYWVLKTNERIHEAGFMTAWTD